MSTSVAIVAPQHFTVGLCVVMWVRPLQAGALVIFVVDASGLLLGISIHRTDAKLPKSSGTLLSNGLPDKFMAIMAVQCHIAII